jgi:hypothetical protein
MTINLKDHMEKKKQEKHIKTYDKIGAAVDGLSIGTVLHILSAFTAAVLNNMDEPHRSKAAMVFSSVIMEGKKDPVQ